MITLKTAFQIMSVVSAEYPRRYSSREIAKACELELRTTQRFLADLENAGLLLRDGSHPAGWSVTQRGMGLNSAWQEGR